MWDPIFSAGTHVSSNGKKKNWTTGELDQFVKNFNDDVPLVIHHPKDQSKATEFGAVAKLRRRKKELQAQYKNIPEALKSAVQEGLQLGKSVAVDLKKMKLNHLGLLGADQPPAVEGLGAATFADQSNADDVTTYVFSKKTVEDNGMDDKDKKITDLEKEIETLKANKETGETKAKLEKAETDLTAEQKAHQGTKDEFSKFKKDKDDEKLSARVDALAETGRIKPSDKDKTLTFAKNLSADEANNMEFAKADGTKETVTPQEAYLMDLEANEPDADGLLSEFAAGDGAGVKDHGVLDLTDINKFA